VRDAERVKSSVGRDRSGDDAVAEVERLVLLPPVERLSFDQRTLGPNGINRVVPTTS
jgi:hypothetical protein